MHGNKLSVVQYTFCGKVLHSIDIYLLYKCIMTFTGQIGQSLEALHYLTCAGFLFN